VHSDRGGRSDGLRRATERRYCRRQATESSKRRRQCDASKIALARIVRLCFELVLVWSQMYAQLNLLPPGRIIGYRHVEKMAGCYSSIWRAHGSKSALSGWCLQSWQLSVWYSPYKADSVTWWKMSGVVSRTRPEWDISTGKQISCNHAEPAKCTYARTHDAEARKSRKPPINRQKRLYGR